MGRKDSDLEEDGGERKVWGMESHHGNTPEAQNARSIITGICHWMRLRDSQKVKIDHFIAQLLRCSFK